MHWMNRCMNNHECMLGFGKELGIWFSGFNCYRNCNEILCIWVSMDYRWNWTHD